MKSTDIKNHKTSISQTHNLEVPGSSPGWSTLKIKHLRVSRKCFFFCRRPLGDLFKAKLYKSELLKFHWIAEIINR